MQQPLVSVSISTYNHEKYIRQCLESVVVQKTSFSFEIIIGEDCSTDNTRTIVKEFELKFPDLIRPIYHDQNVGMMRNGFEFCYAACKGKYVACLEGDDYWTDENKLQKQVDFLEAHEDYSMCYHKISIIESGQVLLLANEKFSDKEETFTIKDLARHNFIYTASVVFRNGLTLPDWLLVSPVGDYVLHMFNANQGLIKYLPESMAAYRFNDGIWASLTTKARTEKWLTVLSFLLKENFDKEVLYILRQQWRENADQYLHSLFPDEQETLTDKLKIFAKEDPTLAYAWATEIYPNYIKKITSSRAYQIVAKAESIKNKLRKNSLKKNSVQR